MTREDQQHCVRDAVQNNSKKYVGQQLIQIVRELDSDLVSDVFIGGVYGCPREIFKMENVCPARKCATEDMCIKCWRRIYPGREVGK